MEVVERAVGVNGSADERPQAADASELLEVRGVFKRFGGTQALGDVGMRLKAGEIVALLGENGAGKSTLIKILAGVYALDAGSISLSRRRTSTHAAATPADRLHPSGPRPHRLDDRGREHLPDARLSASPRPDRSRTRRAARAGVALDKLGADIDPDAAHPEPQRAPRSRWSRSPARWRPMPRSWCSTSRPRACRPTRSSRLFTRLAPPARSRRRHDLRLASARRGVRDRRPHGRAARRPRRGRARRRADDAGRNDPAHRRPRAVAGVQPAGRAPGSAAARASQSVMIGAVGPIDCRHPRRRDRRLRRAARRRAGERSAGRCSASMPLDRRTQSCSTAGHARARSPREAMALGVNLVCADRVGESIMPNLTVRENLFLNPLAAGSGAVFAARARGARAAPRAELGDEVGLRPNDPKLADRAAFGRQPAEGRRRALAASAVKTLCVRGPDRRRRRRREGRDLPAVRRRAAGRARRSSSSRPISRRSPRSAIARSVFDRGRVVAELAADDLSIENLLAAASANIGAERRMARRPDGSARGAHAVH